MSLEKNKTSLKDSINTSLQIGLYKTKEKASLAHTQKAKAKRFSLRFFKTRRIENLGPQRLTAKPYPTTDRPRGKADLLSVTYQRKTIRRTGTISAPIWLHRNKKRRYTMLDGVHRLVAANLENLKTIPVFLIEELS